MKVFNLCLIYGSSRQHEKIHFDTCANNKGTDQSVHPCRLIGAFVVCYSSFLRCRSFSQAYLEGKMIFRNGLVSQSVISWLFSPLIWIHWQIV